MSAKSDTPRTDAFLKIEYAGPATMANAAVQLARQLERELAQARAELGRYMMANNTLAERAEKAEAENKALREELGRFQAGRVQLNGDGSLDEIVGSPGHLEQLDTNHWFVCLGDYAVWLHAKGKITASYEDRAAIDQARQK